MLPATPAPVRPMKHAITRAGLATAATNVALAFWFVLFALAHERSFARTHKPSALLLVVIEAIFALFFLIRAPADRTASSPWAWLSTVGGTFLPMFLRPVDTPQDVLAGQVVQVIGLSFAIYAILSLNRSFGLVPAHRGIRSHGAYRWVRHPLYAAYAVMAAGYLASNFTVRNASILVVAYGCQVARIFEEERLLSSYPDYRDYQARTRWRLLPYLF